MSSTPPTAAPRIVVPVSRSEWVALALVLVAQLSWQGNAPIATWLGFPLMAVALGAWVAHHVRPDLFARVPRWPTAHTLELVSGLLLVAAFLKGDLALGFLLQVAAAVVLARALPPAPPEGRLLDVARLWRSGWLLRIASVVLVLIGLNLGSDWNGEVNSSYTYDRDYGDYAYTYTDTFHQDASDAWLLHWGAWLGLFLAIAVLALIVAPWWQDRPGGLPIVLSALGLLLARSVWLYIDDYRAIKELRDKYDSYAQFQASAPFFCAALTVIAVGLIVWDSRRSPRLAA